MVHCSLKSERFALQMPTRRSLNSLDRDPRKLREIASTREDQNSSLALVRFVLRGWEPSIRNGIYSNSRPLRLPGLERLSTLNDDLAVGLCDSSNQTLRSACFSRVGSNNNFVSRLER